MGVWLSTALCACDGEHGASSFTTCCSKSVLVMVFSTVRAVALMWILECTCWKEQVSIGLAFLQRGKVERKVTLDWVLQPFH